MNSLNSFLLKVQKRIFFISSLKCIPTFITFNACNARSSQWLQWVSTYHPKRRFTLCSSFIIRYSDRLVKKKQRLSDSGMKFQSIQMRKLDERQSRVHGAALECSDLSRSPPALWTSSLWGGEKSLIPTWQRDRLDLFPALPQIVPNTLESFQMRWWTTEVITHSSRGQSWGLFAGV